jgi:hypothetical protein
LPNWFLLFGNFTLPSCKVKIVQFSNILHVHIFKLSTHIAILLFCQIAKSLFTLWIAKMKFKLPTSLNVFGLSNIWMFFPCLPKFLCKKMRLPLKKCVFSTCCLGLSPPHLFRVFFLVHSFLWLVGYLKLEMNTFIIKTTLKLFFWTYWEQTKRFLF